MNTVQKLTEIFTHFPGIGGRQAKRFVYYLLTRDPGTLRDLAKLISELKDAVEMCTMCRRFFVSPRKAMQCDICLDKNREHGQLMIVEKDVDLDTIERSGVYKGLYFVLGGRVPILEKEPEKKVRARDLEKRIKEDGVKETILALSANPEGENTASYVRRLLEPLASEKGFSISTLGRGLSSGSELEYSDAETIRNALSNRK